MLIEQVLKRYPESTADSWVSIMGEGWRHHSAVIADGVWFGDDVIVEENAMIGTGSRIGTCCTIGHRSRLRNNVSLGDTCSIGAGCDIGEGTTLGASVRLSEAVIIKCDTTIEPQVRIGQSVAIGKGVKIDYYASIENDSRVDDDTVIGLARIGELVTIGKNCSIGNNVRVNSLVLIEDNTILPHDLEVHSHASLGPNAHFKHAPLMIQGSRHIVTHAAPGVMAIGCQKFVFEIWENSIESIGYIHGYSKEQIEEYKGYLEFVKQQDKRIFPSQGAE